MATRPVLYQQPGLFEVIFHHSSPAYYPEEHHNSIQIRIPFEGARYNVERSGETGRRAVHHLDARDVLVIPRGQPHAVEWCQPADILSLHLAVDFVQQVLGLANPKIPDTLILRDQSIHTTAEELRSAIRENRDSPALRNAFATVLAYQVGRRASNTAQPLLIGNIAPLRKPQLARTDKFISEHLSEPIKLAELAGLVGLSQWHFIRRFKATRGVGPSAYLVSRRIQHAQGLLRSTTLSVTEIALEVGMSSSHLARTFHFHVGLSPSAYRKIWRD